MAEIKGHGVHRLGCVAPAVAVAVVSCSKLLDTAESDTFRVVVRKQLDFIDLEVQRKGATKEMNRPGNTGECFS
jgi:hypothetical protein